MKTQLYAEDFVVGPLVGLGRYGYPLGGMATSKNLTFASAEMSQFKAPGSIAGPALTRDIAAANSWRHR